MTLKQSGGPRESARSILLNTPLNPNWDLHDAGERYDARVGGMRHLTVRRAFGVYEAAWESTNQPLDEHRLHATSRDRADAEEKLRKRILARISGVSR